MTQNLSKKLLGLASFVFIVVFWGAVFAQRWLDNAYWLPLAALLVVVVLCLLAFITSDKFRSLVQKLIERVPILATFLVLLVSMVAVCAVLVFGLSRGLRISKKYFPGSGTNEAHGTKDSVTAQVAHPTQPAEVVKQPVEKPTAKPPEIVKKPTKQPNPQPLPTVIQTQAPYGNLAARCQELGNAIVSTVDWRLKSRPDPATNRLEYNNWYRENDGLYFHGPYYRDIAKIHKELSDLHIDDPRLGELIERQKTYFASRQQNVQLAIDHPAMFHLSIEEIREIGERFKRLATQIPH